MSEQRHSYSALSTFRACPLRYKLRYLDGLELRDAARNVHHLEYGKAMHAGLEIWYSGPETSGIQSMQDTFAAAYPIQLDPSDKAKTQENGIRALALYVERWREEDRKWKVLEVEGPGTLNYTLDSGLNELHCDLVMENLEHGGVYVWDHKTTTKQLGPWYWDQYSPNSQITGYIDYVQQKYGTCDGFIINAISLQWREPVKSDGKTNNVAWFKSDDAARPWLAYSHHEPREYRGGVLGKKGTYMAAWGLTVGFERQTFNRSEAQIQQERASTAYWKERIKEADRCAKCGWWPQDHNGTGIEGCLDYQPSYGFNTGSCYSCEYRGGEVVGGICRPGYTWPQDSELILLSYRQVCRAMIQVECTQCTGLGIDLSFCDQLRAIAEDRKFLLTLVPGSAFPLIADACPMCYGRKTVDGGRCQLDKGHVGLCSETAPVSEEEEIVIEIEV